MVTIWKRAAYWWFIVSERTLSIFSFRPGTETEKEHYLASPKTWSVSRGSSHSQWLKKRLSMSRKKKKKKGCPLLLASHKHLSYMDMNLLCSSMMTNIETDQANVLCELQVLSVSALNGRHLWALCLSGRSLGAQQVLRLAAGTDAPLSPLQKAPIGCEPSPFIVGGWWWGFCFRKSVSNTSPSRGSCWQQLQQSSCCHFVLPVLPRSAHSRPLRLLFSADQQGSINERPLTITSQLWLSEKTLCVPTKTSFICLIIV